MRAGGLNVGFRGGRRLACGQDERLGGEGLDLALDGCRVESVRVFVMIVLSSALTVLCSLGRSLGSGGKVYFLGPWPRRVPSRSAMLGQP